MADRLCRRCNVIGPHSPSATLCRECRNRARRDYEARARAANKRSEELARERRAAEAADHRHRRAEVLRIAREARLQAAIERRDILRDQRAQRVASLQAELAAERASESTRELRRLKRQIAQAERREAERVQLEAELARLHEALATVCTWAPAWQSIAERMRHARDEARALLSQDPRHGC